MSTKSSSVTKVGDYQAFKELVESGLTIVDFSATWCGPCRRISPVYELFATEYTKVIPELKFLKVDVDEVPAAAQGVGGLPTFQFWVDNQRIDSLTVMGANVEQLKNNINNLLKGNYVVPTPNPTQGIAAQATPVVPQESVKTEVEPEVNLRSSSSNVKRNKSNPSKVAEEPIVLEQEF